MSKTSTEQMVGKITGAAPVRYVIAGASAAERRAGQGRAGRLVDQRSVHSSHFAAFHYSVKRLAVLAGQRKPNRQGCNQIF